MRPAATLMRLALTASSVSPLVSAWPQWLPQPAALIVRADEPNKASATPTPTATSTDEDASSSSESKATRTTESGNQNTATAGSTTSGNKSDKDKTFKPTHTQFAPDAPLGGVSMLDPAVTAVGTALYKIGDFVTFSWNYTSLLGTPTAVDVVASCSANRATWTLASNMSFSPSVRYIWDTKEQANNAQQPLLTEQYTLVVQEADFQATDRPEPGYLGANTALTFGLYAGKPYVNWIEWKCPGCHASAAPPGLEAQALKFAVAMSVITFISFTWFATGLGIN